MIKYLISAALLLVACQNSNTSTQSAFTNKTAVPSNHLENTRDTPQSKTVSIIDTKFTLDSVIKGCEISIKTQKTTNLNLGETCRIHRDETGQVQIMKGHHGPVFLVVSSEKVDGYDECEARIAAVTINDGKMFVQPAQQTTASCIGMEQLDDIYFLSPRFQGLAYPDE